MQTIDSAATGYEREKLPESTVATHTSNDSVPTSDIQELSPAATSTSNSLASTSEKCDPSPQNATALIVPQLNIPLSVLQAAQPFFNFLVSK